MVVHDWGRARGECKNDECCIQNEELCIKNVELCIKNDEFCRRRNGFGSVLHLKWWSFHFKMMEFVLKMMDFEAGRGVKTSKSRYKGREQGDYLLKWRFILKNDDFCADNVEIWPRTRVKKAGKMRKREGRRTRKRTKRAIKKMSLTTLSLRVLH